MNRLEKIKPSGRGLAAVLPERVGGGGVYYPINANCYVHHEEFYGTTLDTDEWADGSSLGTGGAAAPSVVSSFVTLDTSTGTAGTATLKIRSAITSNSQLYSIPFRATFWARVSVTAGSGVAPTGGLDAYFSIRDTGETHIAQFHLDLSTAGGSSLANPVVNTEVRQGSTAAGFINSAATTLFVSGISRTATSIIGYVIEATHRGVAFGVREERGSISPIQALAYSGLPLRIDKQYMLQTHITADGTGGYTQTDGVQLEIDAISVEQFAPQYDNFYKDDSPRNQGAIRSVFSLQSMPSNTVALVTTGAGVFIGWGVASSATAGALIIAAAFDASANGSAIYDFSALPSTAARLLWYQEVVMGATTGTGVGVGTFPPEGIPFYRGLVVGSVTIAGTAVGNSALNILTVFKSNQ